MPETPDAAPPPLIPRDHAMRAFYEQWHRALLIQRQGLDMQIAPLAALLGLAEGNARQRRKTTRAWHAEEERRSA